MMSPLSKKEIKDEEIAAGPFASALVGRKGNNFHFPLIEKNLGIGNVEDIRFFSGASYFVNGF
jgi:hypothetical protein